MRKTIIALGLAWLPVGCQQAPEWQGSLEALLHSQPERFGTVMRYPDGHRVQVIYTQIDRDEANRPSFRSH